MGWCNDVRNKKYNKLIKINKKIRHEKMFRRDYKYDYLIPINYNTKNTQAQKLGCVVYRVQISGSNFGCANQVHGKSDAKIRCTENQVRKSDARKTSGNPMENQVFLRYHISQGPGHSSRL